MDESAEVLNGEARVGDTVALAVRDGNLAAMRLGVVESFSERKPRYGDPKPVMRIRVFRTSGFGDTSVGRVISVECFDRIAVVRGEDAQKAQGETE